jgi:ketosteroid isomerase-like protein
MATAVPIRREAADLEAARREVADREAAEWVAGFAEGWRSPDGPRAFCAHFRPMLAPDVRLIQPQLPPTVGHRAFEEQFAAPLFALIPDARGTVEGWAARAGHVYIELTLRGHIGRRPVRLRVCDRVTLRDGLAIERETYCDPAPLLAAVARSPRAWLPFLRQQARRLPNPRATRRTR